MIVKVLLGVEESAVFLLGARASRREERANHLARAPAVYVRRLIKQFSGDWLLCI